MLAPALRALPLFTLDVSECFLESRTTAAITALCTALKAGRLQYLNLSHNALGTPGMFALAASPAAFAGLHTLLLEGCRAGKGGCLELARLLKHLAGHLQVTALAAPYGL